MKILSLTDILKPIGGCLIKGNQNPIIKYVCTRPKLIRNNTLYFHFKKRKINPKVLFLNKKLIVIVTDNPSRIKQNIKGSIAVVTVEKIKKAYWDFIRYYRSLFKIPVIGVTGTVGKTTTTEMLKKILSTKYNTQSTVDGMNGLSANLQYLLGLDETTEAGVFELGLRSPGWIKQSCIHFQPQVGVLLNIGVYHLHGCKTMENYIKAKAEILEGMQNRGTLIINADDENTKKIDFSRFNGEIIKIGINQLGHYQAKEICCTKEGITFKLYNKNKSYSVFIPGYGKHNVYNALAAIAASNAVGIGIEEAISALTTFKHMRQHLCFRKGINGSTIIDDTWNCNPPGIKAALQVLKETANGRRKVAVIGYMPLLGENGTDEYLKVGESVLKAEVDILVIIGDETKDIGIRALELGMNKNNIYLCNTRNELSSALGRYLDENSLILFKFPYHHSLRTKIFFPVFEECLKFCISS